jgi:hypothetical protein
MLSQSANSLALVQPNFLGATGTNSNLHATADAASQKANLGQTRPDPSQLLEATPSARFPFVLCIC